MRRFVSLMGRGWLLLLALSLVRTVVADPVRGDGELDVLFAEYAARRGGEVAYDAVRGRLVRFGGRGFALGHPPTVEWDADTEAWAPVHTENTPPTLEGHRIVYDAARERAHFTSGGLPPEARVVNVMERP